MIPSKAASAYNKLELRRQMKNLLGKGLEVEAAVVYVSSYSCIDLDFIDGLDIQCEEVRTGLIELIEDLIGD